MGSRLYGSGKLELLFLLMLRLPLDLLYSLQNGYFVSFCRLELRYPFCGLFCVFLIIAVRTIDSFFPILSHMLTLPVQ